MSDQRFMDLHWPQSHADPEHFSVDFVRREYKQWDIFWIVNFVALVSACCLFLS